MKGHDGNNNNSNPLGVNYINPIGVPLASDSMQCSEVLTLNQTNGYLLGSMNQLSANSENLSNNNFSERFPEKRFKPNDSHQQQQYDQYAQQRRQQLQAKEEEKKTQSNLLKEFDFMQFKYSNEEYSYQINTFCKRIASEKHAQEIACKFPLYKMIRSIIKKFLFNELEIIFFSYVLEESKWKVDDIEVRKHAYFMNDFLNITEVKDLLDYKSVLLYLILTAYGVKYYLNEETDMKMFNQHMNTIVRDFSTLFQYWSKNYGQSSFKIVPKSLNRVYRNLTKKPSEINKKQHEDYNALVDAIIQISPPYNNEKPQDQSPDHTPVQTSKSSKSRKKSPSINGFHDKNSMSDLSSSNIPPPAKHTLEQKQETSKSKTSQPHLPMNSASAIVPMVVSAATSIGSKLGNDHFMGGIEQQSQHSQGSAKFGHSPQQTSSKRELGDFPVDFSDNNQQGGSSVTGAATGLLPMSQNGEENIMSSKIIHGYGSANFNDNMEFFSTVNNPLNSNNHYNFNCSYPSLNLGQQLANNYPSFLQQSQMQIDHSLPLGGHQKSVKFTGGNTARGDFTSFTGTSQIQSGAIGGVGNSLGQSHMFNHSNQPFSSGFIGQGNNNNSFNSNHIGFSQLYSQLSANPGGQVQNSSISGLLQQAQQQQQSSSQQTQQLQHPNHSSAYNQSSNPDDEKS